MYFCRCIVEATNEIQVCYYSLLLLFNFFILPLQGKICIQLARSWHSYECLCAHTEKLTRALTIICDLKQAWCVFFPYAFLFLSQNLSPTVPTWLWLMVCMGRKQLMKPQASILKLRCGDDSYKVLVSSSPLSYAFCVVNIKLMLLGLQ